MRRLLALPGDGIGPEIMASALKVLATLGSRLKTEIVVEEAEIGFAALARCGTTMPEAVLAAAEAADGILLGPVSHNAYPPREDGGVNPSGILRKRLDLYANVRPARSWPGTPRPVTPQIDLVVMRENLEGFYADRNMHDGNGEFSPVPGVAMAMRKITEEGSRRIAKAAFALAETREAKHVTAVHKANVMRLTDGLFLETVRAVAAEHPGIRCDEMLVDAAAAHLVRAPERFDVLVTTNMFGDILSDLASELSGGLGLAGSLNIGPHHAAAQAQHGSAPDIAGQNRANPVSLILSLSMLLEHWGERGAARAITAGPHEVFPRVRTPDLGGSAGTPEFTKALISTLEATG